jgi:hypothetical protein
VLVGGSKAKTKELPCGSADGEQQQQVEEEEGDELAAEWLDKVGATVWVHVHANRNGGCRQLLRPPLLPPTTLRDPSMSAICKGPYMKKMKWMKVVT